MEVENVETNLFFVIRSGGRGIMIPSILSDRLMSEKSDCKCRVPCKRILYKSSLSYAQLSRLNVERFVIRDPENKQRLRVRNFLT